MEKEIIWDTRGSRATTRQSKDSTAYTFKNGSTLQNIAASEKTRGARFHSGLMEECVGIDQDILNEIVIPTMNVSRLVNGQVDKNEILNKSQCFITTAGYKGTFAYDKLIQILCQSVARPETAIVLGGSWRVPVIEGLLDRDFVTQLKLDGTFNEASFDREYKTLYSLNPFNCWKALRAKIGLGNQQPRPIIVRFNDYCKCKYTASAVETGGYLKR